MRHCKLLLLPGDNAGVEVSACVAEVVSRLNQRFSEIEVAIEYGDIGGASLDKNGVPLTAQTLERAREVSAIFLGAVGGPKWDAFEPKLRPEKGLLELRSALDLYANLRPTFLSSSLVHLSPLKSKQVADIDLLIVRELCGGLYYGEPRGVQEHNGVSKAYNTLHYDTNEISRIAHRAFALADSRKRRLCSVDKANVLETSELWRQTVTAIAEDYPQVELSHMYVDNAAMQMVTNPNQFDVLLTENMFGDILSDLASVLGGSIGMLPSASLSAPGKPALYEPCHGSAPDIAGKGIVNPCASVLSVAMMYRYSFEQPGIAEKIEQAVFKTISDGVRTADIGGSDSTMQMSDAIIANL